MSKIDFKTMRYPSGAEDVGYDSAGCHQDTVQTGREGLTPSILDLRSDDNNFLQEKEESHQSLSLNDLFRDAIEQTKDESQVQKESEHTPASIAGRAGRQGKESFIAEQYTKAKIAAKNAVLEPYNGEIYRTVNTEYVATYGDHRYNRPGRFNSLNQSAIYNSETFEGLAVESEKYSGLAGKSIVRSHFSGDIVDASRLEGVTRGALTEPCGDKGKHRSLLCRLTGEDPYHHTRAIADGARQKNAAGIRVPADGEVTHLNIFPENIDNLADNYRYLDHLDMQHIGTVKGAVKTDPGVQPPPDGKMPNLVGNRPEVLADEKELHERKGSKRYGAAGAALSQAAVSLQNGDLTGSEMLEIGAQGGMGALTGKADEITITSIHGKINHGFGLT